MCRNRAKLIMEVLKQGALLSCPLKFVLPMGNFDLELEDTVSNALGGTVQDTLTDMYGKCR
jgi:hypothetical protein